MKFWLQFSIHLALSVLLFAQAELETGSAPRATIVEEPNTPAEESGVPRATIVEEATVPTREPATVAPEETPKLALPEKKKKKSALSEDLEEEAAEGPERQKPTPAQLAALERVAAADAKSKEKKSLTAFQGTAKDARTLKLEIPGPRGQIVDRNGKSFANNKVIYYLALNFPVLGTGGANDKVADQIVIDYGRARVNEANKVLGKNWNIPDADLVQHYKLRRWLPLVFSVDPETNLNVSLDQEQIDKLAPYLEKGLMLHPSYQRVYPEEDCACHIIGYTGIRQKMPRKDIVDGEPYTEEPQGRSGLELMFESSLRGTPGMINLLYSPDGELLHQEVLRRPAPGNNIVTTLDHAKQKYAERALRRHAPRGGAMVIVDVQNGDILAMASNPGFDLNEFIPGISDVRFAKLRDNPLSPLHGRAFQGRYPPASTFKAITSIAALECGAISPSTYYHCNTYLKIGEKKFWNWNHKTPEGDLNVVSALKRSCNPFFYQAALDMGKDPLIEMSQRLGFGEVTGIPLPGENAGILPTDAYMMRTQNMRITSGILAQMAIGQVIEASPLQVAQGMAGIANGNSLPKLRLVKQVQDLNDGITEAWDTSAKKQLNFKTASRDAVVKGMVAVVNGSGGTGHQAYVSGAKIAGKTGTAQWKYFGEDDDRNRNLAWFAGFLPADNPQYAFAVVYEGAKGESVSGGQEAAPIVKEVFRNIMAHKEDDPTLIAALKGKRPKDAKEENDDDDTGEDEEETSSNKRTKKSIPKAKPVQRTAAPPPAPPSQPKGLKGLIRKLFKKSL